LPTSPEGVKTLGRAPIESAAEDDNTRVSGLLAGLR
jgi:hypothetical protein